MSDISRPRSLSRSGISVMGGMKLLIQKSSSMKIDHDRYGGNRSTRLNFPDDAPSCGKWGLYLAPDGAPPLDVDLFAFTPLQLDFGGKVGPAQFCRTVGNDIE
jgi:hypothetical protein